jgi:hypothetical protein
MDETAPAASPPPPESEAALIAGSARGPADAAAFEGRLPEPPVAPAETAGAVVPGDAGASRAEASPAEGVAETADEAGAAAAPAGAVAAVAVGATAGSRAAAPDRKNRLEIIVGVRSPVTDTLLTLSDRSGSN